MSSDCTRNKEGFGHTSVAGAGSLARRAAFLDQRVFASDLIYVEPVFFGFKLITDATNATTTERAVAKNREVRKKSQI